MFSELGVKVGDQVIIKPHYGNRQLATVTKVTPSGRFQVDALHKSIYFRPDGHELGAGARGYLAKRAAPNLIRGLEHETEAQKLQATLNRFRLNRLSLEELAALREIIAPYIRK